MKPGVDGRQSVAGDGPRLSPAVRIEHPARWQAHPRLGPAVPGERLPRELIVVGAGVIGLEYASMVTALSIKVTIIEARPTIFDFVDREMIGALCYFMRQRGATFRLGEKVVSVEVDERRHVTAHLESGEQVHGEALLYCVGRQANGDLLNLDAAGLTSDDRGRLEVDEHFQTAVPHIYAAGDVVGFPSLASTSMEQGRLASGHMFGNSGQGPKPDPPVAREDSERRRACHSEARGRGIPVLYARDVDSAEDGVPRCRSG